MVKSNQRVLKLNRFKTKKRIHIGGTVSTHCDCDKCNIVRANSNAGIWLHTTKYIESIHKTNPEYFKGVDKQDILKTQMQIMREKILAEIEDNIRSQIKAGEYKHSKFGNNAKTSTMNVINKMMAKIELLTKEMETADANKIELLTKEMETADANKVNDYLTQISKLKTQLMRIGNDVTLFKEYVYDHEMLHLCTFKMPIFIKKFY